MENKKPILKWKNKPYVGLFHTQSLPTCKKYGTIGDVARTILPPHNPNVGYFSHSFMFPLLTTIRPGGSKTVNRSTQTDEKISSAIDVGLKVIEAYDGDYKDLNS
jgi:hypothetical protein